MRILLTGACGFVGSFLFTELSKEHEVFGICNCGHEIENNVYKLNLLETEDVLDFIAVRGDLKIELMIHLASVMASPSNLESVSVIIQNIHITDSVVKLASKMGIKRILNFSSSSVYPNIDGNYYEDSTVNPSLNSDCFYGLSKFNSEVIFDYALRDKDIRITHLRCSMIHGERMNPNHLIPVLKSEMLNFHSVNLYGKGARLINMTSLPYLLEIVKKIVHNELTGVYNVNERTISLLDLAHEIATEVGLVNVTFNLIPQGNINKFKVDSSKINSN